MMMKFPYALMASIVLCILLQGSLAAQSATVSAVLHPELDQYFSHLEKNNQFMGSVTVLKDGQVLHRAAYGIREATDPDQAIDANADTTYRIGSITKTFTSVLINQLIESGKLSLDDPLSKFFPDVVQADDITIDHLLKHRSGLKNLTATPGYLAWSKQPQSRETMQKRIEELSADFPAGEKTEYSNTNYLILGYIIEQITGKPYAEFLQEKITKPLGLERTYFEPESPIENNASSFRRFKEWITVPATDQSVPHGAGTIESTPSDLTTFITALFDDQLVSQETLQRMTDTSTGMGQGIVAFPFNRKRALGHNGAIDGFRSSLAYFADDDVAISICSNGVVYPFNQMMIDSLTRVFGLPAKLPSFESVEVDTAQLQQYAGTYAADDFPLKITISVNPAGKLMGQATGQGAFPLTANSDTKFRFDAAQIRIEFFESDPGKGFDRFRFQQGPMRREFAKETP